MSGAEGPLAGVRMVEVAHDAVAWAGRLCADLGAEVIVVEPPGGHASRTYEPFLDDVPGPDRSLWWWHYNASKHGVVLDLFGDAAGDAAADVERFRRLVASADVLLEGEAPGRVRDLLGEGAPERLVHVAVTPNGQDGDYPPVVDLTVLAAAGPVWSCGYDDHEVPPVRGGGNQGWQTGCHYAVMSLLTALLAREVTGRGQFIDVNIHASSNVTTEMASYGYLANGGTVQRQTGRHASYRPTQATQAPCGDGNYLNTGVPPRDGKEFRALTEWLEQAGLAEDFPEAPVLALGADVGHISQADLAHDELLGEIFGAGRDAQFYLCERLSAYEAFIGCQERGMAAGAVLSPDDLFADPHFVARGWPTEVEHPELGRTFTYGGVPLRFVGSPMRIRSRAPLVGEHTDQVLDALD